MEHESHSQKYDNAQEALDILWFNYHVTWRARRGNVIACRTCTRFLAVRFVGQAHAEIKHDPTCDVPLSVATDLASGGLVVPDAVLEQEVADRMVIDNLNASTP